MYKVININVVSNVDEEGYSVIVNFAAPIKYKYRFIKYSNKVIKYYKDYQAFFGTSEKYSWGRSSDKYDCWITACFTIPHHFEEGASKADELKDTIICRTYKIINSLTDIYPYIGIDEKNFQSLENIVRTIVNKWEGDLK